MENYLIGKNSNFEMLSKKQNELLFLLPKRRRIP